MVIVRYEGPSGAPGMPEMLDPTSRITALCRESGIVVALMTDARFSGGSVGLVIGHVGPEAALGGPIAFIEDGDEIMVDLNRNELNCTPLAILRSTRSARGPGRRWSLPMAASTPIAARPTPACCTALDTPLSRPPAAAACTRTAKSGCESRARRSGQALSRATSTGAEDDHLQGGAARPGWPRDTGDMQMDERLFRLDGRTALVVGAATEIGRSIALAFGAFGAHVGCIDRNGEGAKATMREIAQAGGKAEAIACDVTDETDVSGSRAAAAWRRAVPPRILVNGAAADDPTGTILELSPAAVADDARGQSDGSLPDEPRGPAAHDRGRRRQHHPYRLADGTRRRRRAVRPTAQPKAH